MTTYCKECERHYKNYNSHLNTKKHWNNVAKSQEDRVDVTAGIIPPTNYVEPEPVVLFDFLPKSIEDIIIGSTEEMEDFDIQRHILMNVTYDVSFSCLYKGSEYTNNTKSDDGGMSIFPSDTQLLILKTYNKLNGYKRNHEKYIKTSYFKRMYEEDEEYRHILIRIFKEYKIIPPLRFQSTSRQNSVNYRAGVISYTSPLHSRLHFNMLKKIRLLVNYQNKYIKGMESKARW